MTLVNYLKFYRNNNIIAHSYFRQVRYSDSRGFRFTDTEMQY